MKNLLLSSSLFGGLALSAFAGAPAVITAPAPDAFANAITPISNPTLAGLALPRTNIHAIYMNQQMPDNINITGGSVPLGGDINVVAVQLEYAFTNRLSLIATKDGYVDFNPDTTLPESNGFANIAAGLKYAFIYDEASQFVLSGSAVIEAPTGNSDVFQGEGKGAANLIVSALKLHNSWQFSGAAGLQLPFDSDASSTSSFISAHASYRVTERFTPLVELNWFHVLDTGDGTSTDISGITEFEGGDLLNLGANNASTNRDIVTLAAGARYKLTNAVSLGAAYEIPLTNDENNLMKSRITADLVWTF